MMSEIRGYFDRVRRFVGRNWGTLALGCVAVPTFIRLTEVASRQYIAYTTTRTHQLLLRFKKQRMFEMIEESFPESFKTWHALMIQSIKEVLNSEVIMDKIRNREGDKMDHWLELKIYAFATINVLVYGTSLLSVLLRIQTSVISGLLFKQMEYIPAGLEELEGTQGNTPHIGIITDSVQQDYMKLTRYLCTTGVKRLAVSMFDKTFKALQTLQLKSKLSVADIDRYLVQSKKTPRSFQPIHQDLEEEVAMDRNDFCPIKDAWYYLLDFEEAKQLFCVPNEIRMTETDTDILLRNLFGEAYDLIRSKDTVKLLKYLEINGRNNYLDRVAEFMSSLAGGGGDAASTGTTSSISDVSVANSDETVSSQDDEEFRAPRAYVAKLIPFMNSLVDVPYEEDTWVDVLLNNSTLKTFSANIYESYSAKYLNQV